jgi:hypothetical protein
LVEVEHPYFYQILSPLNKLKTISEGVLLLPNTVSLEQVEDYIYQRVFYFYQILSPFNKLNTISEGVLLSSDIVFDLFKGNSIW